MEGLDSLEHLVSREKLVREGILEGMERLGCQDRGDNQVQQAKKDLKDLLVYLVRQGEKEIPEAVARLVFLDLKEHLD